MDVRQFGNFRIYWLGLRYCLNVNGHLAPNSACKDLVSVSGGASPKERQWGQKANKGTIKYNDAVSKVVLTAAGLAWNR